MNSESLAGRPFAIPSALRAGALVVLWRRLALAGVLVIAAGMDLFRLGREGYGNLYYAAAVKSMLTSWHNFFFVSFDPGGFVTVDKPPLGLWLQAGSAELFGFHGWSLLLPQALAGVASVALLYHLVRQAWGEAAGLLAALALAVSPISVVTNRNNTMDSTLALTVLLAAWAMLHAAESGRLRWLLLSMAIVGVGFGVKMLEAYLVLPALALLYLLTAPRPWLTRIGQLALGSVVLLAVSLWWPVAVDLTPASQRPFVGSTTGNSEFELILGHNGLDRVLPGRSLFPRRAAPSTESRTDRAQTSTRSGFFGQSGRGLLRLMSQELAGQISWLLPLALIGIVAAGWRVALRRPIGREQRAVVLWGSWLITELAFFSYTQQFQPYYLTVLAPAIGASVGIGVVALWRAYRSSAWSGWLLPVAVVATGLTQIRILRDYPDWSHRLKPVIVAAMVAIALALVVGRIGPVMRRRALLPAAVVALAVLSLLTAPAVWAGVSVLQGSSSRPYAGPRTANGGRFGGFAFVSAGSATTPFRTDGALIGYLEAHQGSARFLVGVLNAGQAEPIILETGKPVMALGGFSGSDPILTPDQLAGMVQRGEIHYFLMPQAAAGSSRGFGFGFGDGGQQADDVAWVNTHCIPVPSDQWQGSTVTGTRQGGRSGFGGFEGGAGQQLFSCQAVGA